MTHINELVEQHIRAHESRLKHIDELLQRTQKAAGQEVDSADVGAQLKELQNNREELHDHIQKLKHSPGHWTKNALNKAGPMGVWDAVAQRLEKLVERIERKTGPD